jgi:predicted DCC family thiol-disulfide oxidoreductase YuxK
MINFIDKIISKSSFPKEIVAVNEFKKNAVFRILAGAIILVRFAEIFYTSYYMEGRSLPNILLLAFTGIIFMFMIGAFTPVTNVILIVCIPIADSVFNTNTLGSTIAVNLLVVNLFLNSGQYFSIDKWLINKKNRISHFVLKLYKIIGVPTEKEIIRIYFLSFLLYAISSFYALILHAQDEYWLGGLTVKSMLTNTFLCKSAFMFRSIESSIPYLLDVISITAIIGQSIFQILMIPLMFFSIGKKYVTVWGFIFFIISLFFLSLSYLPHLEIILWILIFCPLSIPKDKIKILYDDKCNLCKNALSFFKLVNINQVYEFIAISKNRDYYETYNLNEVEVKTYMVGFYKEEILKGYDLYLLIFYKNPLVCALYPFLWLGKISKLGYIIYNYIAQNRYKLFGTCEISYDDEIQKSNAFPQINTHTSVVKYVFSGYGIVIGLLVLVNNPLFSKIISKTKFSKLDKVYIENCKRVGIEIPNVFNKTDLSMGDNFMVISKKISNKWVLVPVIGLNGERLNYQNFDILLFSNHNSDAFYFSHTLKYRRKLIDQLNDVANFHEHNYGKQYIKFLINYDYTKSKHNAPVQYKVEVYSGNASKVILFENNFDRFNVKKIYERTILFDKFLKL